MEGQRDFVGDLAFGADFGSLPVDLAGGESEAEVGGRRGSIRRSSRLRLRVGIKGVGGDRCEIAGTLSLKRASQRSSSVALKRDAANSVAEGEFKVRRLDFKVGEGMWADTDTIANDVTVRVRMVLPPAQ
jgi:hypothetical protein